MHEGQNPQQAIGSCLACLSVFAADILLDWLVGPTALPRGWDITALRAVAVDETERGGWAEIVSRRISSNMKRCKFLNVLKVKIIVNVVNRIISALQFLELKHGETGNFVLLQRGLNASIRWVLWLHAKNSKPTEVYYSSNSTLPTNISLRKKRENENEKQGLAS